MGFLTALKRGLFPRKPPVGAPPEYREFVMCLTFFLGVPTRYCSDDELDTLAQFYGDSPRHCVFITLRILYEVIAKWPDIATDRASELSTAILQALFGEAGAEVLAWCSQDALKREDVGAIEGRSRALQCVQIAKDTRKIRAIPEFQQALERGRELASTDPMMRGKPDEFVAYVGLHYVWLIDHLRDEYEPWLIQRTRLEFLGKFVRLMEGASSKAR